MNNCHRHRLLLLVTMLFAVQIGAQQPSSDQAKNQSVWIWSRQCVDHQNLGVKIKLKGRTLYQGVLPICLGERTSEDGRVEFHFSGGHFFQGEYRTHSGEMVEGDIWQAGGELDALVLGVSFATRKQILLNTLHIAKPDRESSIELDKNLFITTYPAN